MYNAAECCVSGGALVPETLGTDYTQGFVFNTAISENTWIIFPELSYNAPPYMIIFPPLAKNNN